MTMARLLAPGVLAMLLGACAGVTPEQHGGEPAATSSTEAEGGAAATGTAQDDGSADADRPEGGQTGDADAGIGDGPAGSGATDEPATDSKGAASTEAPEVNEPPEGGDGGVDGGPPAITVELMTISGGEYAGTYSGSVPVYSECSRDIGTGTFDLTYTAIEEDAPFTVGLIVNDPAAAAEGTDDFSLLIIMGSDVLIEIQGPPYPIGTGTVTVDDRGATATITIQGQTAEGVGVEAEVTCHSVFDFGDFSGSGAGLAT